MKLTRKHLRSLIEYSIKDVTYTHEKPIEQPRIRPIFTLEITNKHPYTDKVFTIMSPASDWGYDNEEEFYNDIGKYHEQPISSYEPVEYGYYNITMNDGATLEMVNPIHIKPYPHSAHSYGWNPGDWPRE